MKISTKGRYGLRLMLDLATFTAGEPVPLKEIAERQDISDKYLEQIVTHLNRAGLVRSIRGAQGGYTMGMSPSQITIGDILRATEGSVCLVDCAKDPNCCEKSEKCIASAVWRKVHLAVEDVVNTITLQDAIDGKL